MLSLLATSLLLAAAPVDASEDASASNEISIARQALRDGLWDVARQHAGNAGNGEGLLILLESFARGGKWDEVLSVAGSQDGAARQEIAYYRALALYKTGRGKDAADVLAAAQFEDESYRILGKRLEAMVASEQGDSARAVRLLKEADCERGDAAAKCAVADIYSRAGDRKQAERIWREVADSKESGEAEFTTAAVNLGDVALLREAVEKTADAGLRRQAGLRLGAILCGDDSTFEEGAAMIVRIVRDAPDVEGARYAMAGLADAYLRRGEWAKAADSYRDVLVTWPEAALSATVQDGLGRAFGKLGRVEEAIEAFSRAEELFTEAESKANAAASAADALSAAGRTDEAMAKYRDAAAKYQKTPTGDRVATLVRRFDMEQRARELYRGYRFAEAQRIFDKIAEEDPARRDKAELFGALCLYGQGMDEAAADKARLLAEGCTNATVRAEATLWLAKLLYNRRQWKDSCRLFSSYADQRPDSPKAPDALVWSARAAFAENDFPLAIRIVSSLAERYPDSVEKARGHLVQGEALIELARFDEAVLVLERTLLDERTPLDERMRAELLRADAFFAMGADNPARYEEALAAYRRLRQGKSLSSGMRLAVSFKMGRTLEKLRRIDEAIDQYYTGVVLAYREGRQNGVSFDDEARAAFARAAFRLADEFESRGKDFQAMHILELVVSSDVPASDEAEKRIDRIQTKGKFL